MESFLKEQLKRIQALTERLSSVEQHAAELSREMERDREQVRQGPFAAVRDVRPYRSSTEPRSEANDRPPPRPRRTAPRRRRR
jgi:hypothetical protein